MKRIIYKKEYHKLESEYNIYMATMVNKFRFTKNVKFMSRVKFYITSG